MSPDLEWQVGEESDRETIVKTAPRKPPRWRWLVIAFVVMLGAGLGALYRSIPEPPQPTPLPTSTPLPPPPPIGTMIEQEAHALATGDRAAFLALQDQNDGDWYRAQQAAFQTWGTPPSNAALYTIVESGTLSSGQVWVDLYQWRDADRYFRETRFYRLRDNRWQRVRPSPSFWSGLEWKTERTPSSTPPYAPPYASYIPFSLVSTRKKTIASHGTRCSAWRRSTNYCAAISSAMGTADRLRPSRWSSSPMPIECSLSQTSA